MRIFRLGMSLARTLVAVVMMLLTLPALAAQSDRLINMTPGSVETVKIGNIKRVAVGLETVAAASVLDTGDLLIIARTVGTTDIRVWTEGDRPHRLRINVAQQAPKTSSATIKAALKGIAGVSVREESGLIFIEGGVDEPEIKRAAEVIASLTETGFIGSNVLNLLYSKNLPLSPMIRIDVKFVEINKGALQKFGIKWQSVIPGPSIGAHFSSTVNPAFRIQHESTEDMTRNIPLTDHEFYGYFGLTTFSNSLIDILAEDNQAKVLAAPVLITQNNSEAKFLSGGEIPIPYTDNDGRLTVVFKEYGVKLEVLPRIDSNNTINSSILAEVSDIDPATQVNGIPGFLTRKTESTISVKDGETIVISGIISSKSSNGASKVPYLGDIPILGELFKSKSFNNSQSELVIFVTPHRTAPAETEHQKLLKQGQDAVSKIKNDNALNNAILD